MQHYIRLFIQFVTFLFVVFNYSISHASDIYIRDFDSLTDFASALHNLLPNDKQFDAHIEALFSTYTDYCIGVEVSCNTAYLIMSNGSRIIYDDKKDKTYQEKLDNPDLHNMLEQQYKTGGLEDDIPIGFDPGRFRVRSFFEAVYGASLGEVKANCVEVDFLQTSVLFSRNNGASRALGQVAEELKLLVSRNPELKKFISPIGGTLNRRKIAGTDRLSPHSFGIAIDLNPRNAGYWLWKKSKKTRQRREYPMEIVRAFEKHGFIWGGKWYHYDLMHFEYRPELLFDH